MQASWIKAARKSMAVDDDTRRTPMALYLMFQLGRMSIQIGAECMEDTRVRMASRSR